MKMSGPSLFVLVTGKRKRQWQPLFTVNRYTHRAFTALVPAAAKLLLSFIAGGLRSLCETTRQVVSWQWKVFKKVE